MQNTTTASSQTQKQRSVPLSVRLHPLVKKIHAYLGLVNLSFVLIWGIVGLDQWLNHRAPGPPPVSAEWTLPYKPAPDATDREIGLALRALINPSQGTSPNLQRDADGNLIVMFYTSNGPTKATVVEANGIVRVQKRHTDVGRFLNNMHATSTQDVDPSYLALRIWTYFTEISIWSLLTLSLSGLLMWLLSRPKYIPAQLSFLAGLGMFAFLYMAAR